jgi:7,8-dihydroneopterin aldolase/epimerase/oxygenase
VTTRGGLAEPVTESTTLFVRGLRIRAKIGVHDHERQRRQVLVIETELRICPLRGVTLADTIDYGVVVSEAKGVAASGHVMLVETFAERLCRALLCYPLVERVTVRVAKPAALVTHAEAAGAEIVMVRGLAGAGSQSP